MPRTNVTPRMVESMIVMYAGGASLREVARTYGVSPETVRLRVRAAGVQPAQMSPAPTHGARRAAVVALALRYARQHAGPA